jgi:DNA-binding transcriptional ArsR family regulator
MAAAQFDSELDRVIAALDHETRRDLMAFYVSETTSPAAIAQNLKVELPALAYHTQVLLKVGAIEAAGFLGTTRIYKATDAGQMAYVKVTGESD